MEQSDFRELVIKTWNTPCAFTDPLEIWQFKIRLLRKKTKGWSWNRNAEIKKLKTQLLKEFEDLDAKQERGSLSLQDRTRMHTIINDLEALWRMEEIKVRQRSRERRVKEGDRNTAYFQALANQRNRKNRISGLKGPEGLLEENDAMLKHVVSFYKNLFGKEENAGVSLGEDFWEEGEKVCDEENDMLRRLHLRWLKLRRRSLAHMLRVRQGPDGSSFLFYQAFWDIIKGDLMALVKCFEQGHLNLDRLNYTMITLILKEPDARTLKKFRPISLINCSFKIFAKMLNNRLIKVANRLLASNQTAFIKGRYILESVVAAHEILHKVHRKKESGIILKLDYEKAYDRVSWDFLGDMLKS